MARLPGPLWPQVIRVRIRRMKTHGPVHVSGFVEPMFQENGYLLWSGDGPEAWIVDPSFAPQPEQIMAAMARHGLKPAAIVITHAHVDHIAGIEELRAEYAELPILAPRDEATLLPDANANLSAAMGLPVVAPEATRLISPGDKLVLGPLTWRALDVSGHSLGGMAYYCAAAGVVLTGDALFAGSIGRTDFPGGSYEGLIANIRRQLLSLPDDTVVYSGHGPATTIGDERARNPFLHAGD